MTFITAYAIAIAITLASYTLGAITNTPNC